MKEKGFRGERIHGFRLNSKKPSGRGQTLARETAGLSDKRAFALRVAKGLMLT